ncbi:AraC-like DNA-binding protein [Actinoplanes octamycinicus]|uniref:AraC-like DNA-binding protein n=1 Tax=Actinoplanes octamycinicus TaxID=135948 RepID=A0A7W7H5Y9_9ACTN|nr:AraC family transcriptional regulator [Actinoplanes octamycinicus]MBB4744277.1 AraC-like DNA-binding protein [Actinoplanes octamycinicus]
MQATSHHITDIDEARAILRKNFYPLDVEVLNPVPSWTAHFEVGGDDRVTLGVLDFGVDVRISAGETGAYHVNLPLTGAVTWHQGRGELRRAEAGRTAAVNLPVGDAYLDSWDGDCRLLAVKIGRGELESQLERMLDQPVRGPIDFAPVLDVDTGAGASWARLVRMVATDTGTPEGLTGHPVIGTRMREALVTGLLLAADHRYRGPLEQRTPALAAPGAIRRVVEAMRAQPGRPFTVADLGEIAGVGARSLQQSFARYVGMPPMTYLRQLRLGLVHECLRAADPATTTVAQVAYRYGFTHLGRFAVAYRERYNVSPSETLRG